MCTVCAHPVLQLITATHVNTATQPQPQHKYMLNMIAGNRTGSLGWHMSTILVPRDQDVHAENNGSLGGNSVKILFLERAPHPSNRESVSKVNTSAKRGDRGQAADRLLTPSLVCGLLFYTREPSLGRASVVQATAVPSDRMKHTRVVITGP